MESFIIGGETIKYAVRKGKIIDVESYSNTNTMSYSSSIIRTDIHQTFYIEDKDGKQFVVKLEGWEFPGRKGHELILVWVETAQRKDYALIYNKSLDSVHQGAFHKFFIRYEDIPLGAYAIVALPVIGIPSFFYTATRSNMVGFITFIIAVIVARRFLKKHTDKQRKSVRSTTELKNKVLEILNHYKNLG